MNRCAAAPAKTTVCLGCGGGAEEATTPTALTQADTDLDLAAAKRVDRATVTMGKIDIASIKAVRGVERPTPWAVDSGLQVFAQPAQIIVATTNGSTEIFHAV